jgi:ribosomal protein S18 acetylase RimI-like enzyme
MGLPEQVRTVHADAWEVQGRLRERFGGGVHELHGIRLTATGLPDAEFNGGDVTALDADIEGARAFYAARGADWGVRVPVDLGWERGHRHVGLRLLGLEAAAFRPVPAPDGVELREAVAHDVDALLAIDSVAFGTDPGTRGRWIVPMLGAPEVTVAIGELHGEPVATGYAVHTDGRAGPGVHLGGIGVLPAARGHGIATALSSWLLEAGWKRGARLAELHADSDAAAQIYARLGFFEAGGLDVYVGL